ncbi:U3 small nucleolar RNA-associated protein 18 homolog [Anabrus simplex]|uniref:U3 small nucleolar RNA-associated protein 18 homolog n=1 Tax=Anabrus simplex TaxID=316456 RepID=UPI0035A3C498
MIRSPRKSKKESKKRKIDESHSDDGDSSQRRKFKRRTVYSADSMEKVDMDEEQARLEKLVFGDASEVLEHLDSRWDSDEGLRMVTQNTESEDSGVDEGDASPASDALLSDTLGSPKRIPVWHDDDDQEISIKAALSSQQERHMTFPGTSSQSYTHLLKRKFEDIVGTPKWAQLDRKDKPSDSDDDSDDELLQHCGNFLSKKSSVLNKGILEIKRVNDLNRETYTEGPVIKTVQFHPNATVSLVAGLSGVASLFQVDGHSNSKLQSIQFERFPIRCARFTVDGEQFLVGSQHHSHYFRYDMMAGKSLRIATNQGLEITNMKNFEMSPDGRLIAVCGRFGNIYLLTARSNECVGSLKMNGEVSTVCFNADGSKMFSHGDGGEVYVWDMTTRSCVHRFVDDGCIVGSSLAISPNGQYLATGSRSGVVNVFETSDLVSNSVPQPVKILLNLTTAITSLKYNKASEILAMASDDKDNALKLVHFPSMNVYANFPGFQAKIHRPQCLDFSTNSGFLTVGNNKGMALLYRLKHYANY